MPATHRRYLARLNMTHEDAVGFLRELATPDSPTRKAVEANPRRELRKRGINLYWARQVPKQITLPPPEQIQALLDQAQVLAGDRTPFAWVAGFAVLSGT